MSYDDPEEDLLDQHLREAFSEFELPPANRVWKGIEGRVGALPSAAQPLVPLKFWLPVALLAGVAGGWLLPRPTAPTPTANAPVAHVAQIPATSPASIPVVAAPAMAAPVPASLVVANARRLAAMPVRAAKRLAPVAPLASPSLVLASSSVPAPAALFVPDTDSNAAVSALQASATSAVPGARPEPVAATIETPKTDGAQGFHAEFRQPTHRRAEKGRSIRRRLSAVGRWARHLVSPRRVRTAGQPSF